MQIWLTAALLCLLIGGLGPLLDGPSEANALQAAALAVIDAAAAEDAQQ
jgi:hypothetical protein